MRGQSNDNQQAENRLKQILEGLQSNDKDSLKRLFSNTALNQADDIDEGIDNLFAFFQGNIVSYNWNGNSKGPIVDEVFENENKKKELKSWFDVITDKGKYIFFFVDYPIDTFERDNVGLYTLRVIKEENKNTQLTNWQDMKKPGIHIPSEQ